jgi:cob(I)alamin adenosyltransferase
MVRLAESEAVNEYGLQYINRLSDALFVFARSANRLDGATEERWK